MKQFIVDRHTTPNTPTLEQVPTEKIPIYDDRAAVTADLANLEEGQIVATKDTGTELSQPVNAVESGNLHAVTSNAVAESLSYSTTEQATGGKWIDGKPIYRKVLSGTISSANMDVAHNIANIDKVINAQGFAMDNGSNIPSGFFATTSYFFSMAGDRTQYHIRTTTAYGGMAFYFIFEYTKTTD